jgi:hypothetical protein
VTFEEFLKLDVDGLRELTEKRLRILEGAAEEFAEDGMTTWADRLGRLRDHGSRNLSSRQLLDVLEECRLYAIEVERVYLDLRDAYRTWKASQAEVDALPEMDDRDR